MNSTLQRLTDLELSVKEISNKLTAFSSATSTSLKLEQDTASLRNDLTKVAEALASLNKSFSMRVNQIEQMFGFLAQKSSVSESTLEMQSKIMSAVIAELISNGSLADDAVVRRLRAAEDADSEERVKQMLQMGLIKETEESTADSMLVVSQTVTGPDGSDELVFNNKVIEVSHPANNEESKSKLVGKKVGDTFELTDESGETMKYTVKAVYIHSQVTSEGEAEAETEAAEASS